MRGFYQKHLIPKTEEKNSTLTSRCIPFFLNEPLQAVTSHYHTHNYRRHRPSTIAPIRVPSRISCLPHGESFPLSLTASPNSSFNNFKVQLLLDSLIVQSVHHLALKPPCPTGGDYLGTNCSPNQKKWRYMGIF